MYFKHFRNAFIFGFCIELMITKSRICNFNYLLFQMKTLLEKVLKEDQNRKKKKMIIFKKQIIIYIKNENINNNLYI